MTQATPPGGRKEGEFDADLSGRDTWPPQWRHRSTWIRSHAPVRPSLVMFSSIVPGGSTLTCRGGRGGLLRRRRARSLGRSGWSSPTVVTSRSPEHLFFVSAIETPSRRHRRSPTARGPRVPVVRRAPMAPRIRGATGRGDKFESTQTREPEWEVARDGYRSRGGSGWSVQTSASPKIPEHRQPHRDRKSIYSCRMGADARASSRTSSSVGGLFG